jgi:hypothetical protein
MRHFLFRTNRLVTLQFVSLMLCSTIFDRRGVIHSHLEPPRFDVRKTSFIKTHRSTTPLPSIRMANWIHLISNACARFYRMFGLNRSGGRVDQMFVSKRVDLTKEIGTKNAKLL